VSDSLQHRDNMTPETIDSLRPAGEVRRPCGAMADSVLSQ